MSSLTIFGSAAARHSKFLAIQHQGANRAIDSWQGLNSWVQSESVRLQLYCLFFDWFFSTRSANDFRLWVITKKVKGLVAVCHSFCIYFSFLYNRYIHTTSIQKHWLRPIFMSSQLSAQGGTSMGCRAEIRTRVFLKGSWNVIFSKNRLFTKLKMIFLETLAGTFLLLVSKRAHVQ